jgi:Helix-turn-helix domain
VVTTAGDRGVPRRVRRRRRPGNTPALVGSALQGAREAAGVSLAEVHECTGILWPQLEGLEAGDLSRFADKRAAVVAVRRYADLVNLDARHCAAVVEQHWGSSLAGFGGELSGNGTGSGHGATVEQAGTGGHLSRFPGDATHLRAFTQTAQVPGVRRVGPSQVTAVHGAFETTGNFPAVGTVDRGPRRPPWILRAAVWLAASLLVVAGAGLAVHHWRPQWLRTIHLEHASHLAPAPGSPAATGSTGNTGSASTGSAGNTGTSAAGGSSSNKNALVSTTQSGPGSAAVSVQAGTFSVVVLAWARCWIQVETPQSFTPVFNSVLNAGQVQTFTSAEGQLTLNLGASLVTVQVKVGGKTAPGWTFKPTNAPFVVNFTSTTGTSD